MTDDLDVRLQQALAARAGQVTADRLRPAEVPRGVRRMRSWAVPVLAGAAAMAVLVTVLVVWPPDRAPQQPAVPPVSPASVAPSPSPSEPAPPPAVVEPSPGPSRPGDEPGRRPASEPDAPRPGEPQRSPRVNGPAATPAGPEEPRATR